MNISLKKRTKNWGLKNKAGEIIGIEKLNFLPAGFSEKSVDRLQDRDQILGFEFDPRRYERSAAVG